MRRREALMEVMANFDTFEDYLIVKELVAVLRNLASFRNPRSLHKIGTLDGFWRLCAATEKQIENVEQMMGETTCLIGTKAY
jgi:hypothetical protein